MAGFVTMSSVLLQATTVEATAAFTESLTNSNNFVIANGGGPASWGKGNMEQTKQIPPFLSKIVIADNPPLYLI